MCINPLCLHRTLCVIVCYPHSREEETETQRSTAPSPRLHGAYLVVSQVLRLRSPCWEPLQPDLGDGLLNRIGLLTFPRTFTGWSYFILRTGLVVKWGRRQSCQFTCEGLMMPVADEEHHEGLKMPGLL